MSTPPHDLYFADLEAGQAFIDRCWKSMLEQATLRGDRIPPTAMAKIVTDGICDTWTDAGLCRLATLLEATCPACGGLDPSECRVGLYGRILERCPVMR